MAEKRYQKSIGIRPLKLDFRRALSSDGTIKTEAWEDLGEIPGENVFDAVYK